MKTFMDQLKEDSENAFFCMGEFAETHIIDGRETRIVLENETLLRLNLGKASDADGIFEDSRMFFARKEDLDPAPAIGQVMEFDGEAYQVGNVLEDCGGYAIILRGNAG